MRGFEVLHVEYYFYASVFVEYFWQDTLQLCLFKQSGVFFSLEILTSLQN